MDLAPLPLVRVAESRTRAPCACPRLLEAANLRGTSCSVRKARASELAVRAQPEVDVRAVRSVLMAAAVAPKHVGLLIVVGAREISRSHNDLIVAIPVPGLSSSFPLRHCELRKS